MKPIQIVEVKSELGAGTRGASLGVDAIKIASVNDGSDFFARHETIEVPVDNSPLFTLTSDQYSTAHRIEDVLEVQEIVCEKIAEVSKTHFPLVLGGDHANAAGVIMGMKMANPDKRIGVVWIDAHADLHTPYTTPSGNMHGMPLAICLGIDNLEEQINEPGPDVVEEWEELKRIGGEGAKISFEDIVYIGLRSTEGPEDALIARHNIKVFTVEDVTYKLAKNVVKETLECLQHCDMICVSFDVDSMDSSISVGTGTPEPDGLTIEQAIQLNCCLVRDPKVASWEMVEINPTLDTANRMGEVAFEILREVVEARETVEAHS
jgi:arginase